MARDVTERKRAEEELKESEERYRLVARATNESIWDSDIPNDRQVWNGAVEAMFGYPAHQVTDSAWWEERVHPEERERVLSNIEAALEDDGEMWLEEYRFRRADGEYATVVDRAYIVRDAQGKPVRLIGSMMDVTERRRAEDALRRARDELETRVEERTSELAEANRDLERQIEGRRQVEEALRESEDRLNAAIQATDLGTWDFDPITGALRWDDRCKAMFGLPPEAGADYGVFLAGLHPGDRERTDRIVQRTLDPASGGEFDTEYRAIGLEDGVERWVAARGQAFFDERGRAHRFIGTVLDITERKRAEEALRGSEERFRSLVQNSHDMITLLTAEGVITYQSPSIEQVLGREAGGLVGTNVFESLEFHPDDLAEVRAAFAELAATPRSAVFTEARVRHADGSWRTIESVFANLIEDPAVGGIVGNSRDVTERKQAEEALRRARDELEERVEERTAELAEANTSLEARNVELAHKNEEIETFVYSVSHDLRSPLVNLQGFSQEIEMAAQNIREMFDEDGAPPEVRRRALELVDEDMAASVRFIRAGVGRLSGIIDALLRLSRAGRVEYRRQRVDPNAIVRRILDSMEDTISRSGVRVEVRDLPSPVWGDQTALEQVFANLIGNAVKYLDPQRPGLVEVGSKPAERGEGDPLFHTYYVRDNGKGIPGRSLGKVFRIFQRLHPEVGGEGVGLALAQQVVQRHEGRIWVESEEGAGSAFFVRLPASPAERALEARVAD